MYCTKCGTENPVDSTFCVSCGAPLNQESTSSSTNNFQQPQNQAPTYQNPNSGYVNNSYQPVNNGIQGSPVSNNMVLSVITLVFSVFAICSCNFVSVILSIIATVFSSQVNQKLAMGLTDEATKAAKTSKILSLISIGIMVLGIIGYIVIIALGGLSSLSSYSNY